MKSISCKNSSYKEVNMVQTLLTALTSYIGTTSDYFVVLLLVFGQYRGPKQTRSIIFGAYLGNALLVLIALLVAVLLKNIPESWLLGFLGIVPIVIGIRKYFSNDDETEEVKDKLAQDNNRNLISNMVIITIGACGADNLALYMPYFATANLVYLPAILLIFIAVLTIVIFLAKKLTDFKPVHTFFERFGDKIQVIIYIVLGLYVMFDAGTIQYFISLL